MHHLPCDPVYTAATCTYETSCQSGSDQAGHSHSKSHCYCPKDCSPTQNHKECHGHQERGGERGGYMWANNVKNGS